MQFSVSPVFVLFSFLFLKTIFFSAEKSGYGDEEGWGQGTDNDDIVLGCSVHCFICSGLLDLGSRVRNQLAISHTWKRVVMIRNKE